MCTELIMLHIGGIIREQNNLHPEVVIFKYMDNLKQIVTLRI